MDWWEEGHIFQDWNYFIKERIPGPDDIQQTDRADTVQINGAHYHPPFSLVFVQKGERVAVLDRQNRELVNLKAPYASETSRLGRLTERTQPKIRRLLQNRVDQLNEHAENVTHAALTDQFGGVEPSPSSEDVSPTSTNLENQRDAPETRETPATTEPAQPSTLALGWSGWSLLVVLLVGTGIILWKGYTPENWPGTGDHNPVYASPIQEISLYDERDLQTRMMHPISPRGMVRVQSCQEDWCLVEDRGGAGWAQARYLRALSEAQLQHEVVLRSTPDEDATAGMQVTGGTQAYIHGCQNQKCRVLIEISEEHDVRTGWVASDALTQPRTMSLATVR